MLVDDNIRRFEAHLRALDEGMPPDAPGEVDEVDTGDAGEHAAVRNDLHLIAALRDYQMPRAEAVAARGRVHARLLNLIASGEEEYGSAAAGEHLTEIDAGRRLQRKRWRHRARVAAAIAAILILGAISGWQISTAAAAAYPNSPLYSVKRLEERVALETAWSDQRKGAVFATIANHRLNELTYEAKRHEEPLVQSLAEEYDNTMRSLINLASGMQRKHEDTTAVLAVLTHELNAEGAALQNAQSSGDAALTAALASTVQSQQSAISAGDLNIAPPALGQPQRNGPMQNEPHPTATPHGQGAEKQSQPNNGNNGDSGNGSNGNSGGTGKHGGQSEQGSAGDTTMIARASVSNSGSGGGLSGPSGKSAAPRASANSNASARAANGQAPVRTAHTPAHLPAANSPAPARTTAGVTIHRTSSGSHPAMRRADRHDDNGPFGKTGKSARHSQTHSQQHGSAYSLKSTSASSTSSHTVSRSKTMGQGASGSSRRAHGGH